MPSLGSTTFIAGASTSGKSRVFGTRIRRFESCRPNPTDNFAHASCVVWFGTMIKALSIFSGNANRELVESICRCVEVRLGAAEVNTFSDGEIFVEIRENVRGINCFVVQPTCSPVNQNLMELLIMVD